jgi:hypothetical protein
MSTKFSSGTIIESSWLNQVDDLVISGGGAISKVFDWTGGDAVQSIAVDVENGLYYIRGSLTSGSNWNSGGNQYTWAFYKNSGTVLVDSYPGQIKFTSADSTLVATNNANLGPDINSNEIRHFAGFILVNDNRCFFDLSLNTEGNTAAHNWYKIWGHTDPADGTPDTVKFISSTYNLGDESRIEMWKIF